MEGRRNHIRRHRSSRNLAKQADAVLVSKEIARSFVTQVFFFCVHFSICFVEFPVAYTMNACSKSSPLVGDIEMVGKKKLANTAAATFGVALASVYVTAEIQAEIMDLTYNGGAPMFSNPFVASSGGLALYIGIDQVPNITAYPGLSTVDFAQWNDTYGGTGRTMPFFGNTVVGPLSMDVVESGQVIDPATFVGATLAGDPALIGQTVFDGTGSAFVAIRPRSAPDNLYWFKLEYTVEGPIVYSTGQYGSEGEALTVNDTGDCPNTLGDINGDGVVTLLDVGPFVDLITGDADFNCAGDFTDDGEVTLLDVAPFVDSIGG